MAVSLYFGCAREIDGRREAGHYFYASAEGHLLEASTHIAERLNPWGIPDGTLAPRPDGSQRRECAQGVAALHHKDGWTALSFWDRSGDSRGASNSTFLFDDVLSFDNALARAQARFPALFQRFPFEVTEYHG